MDDKRNQLDKKFLDDYLDVFNRGYTLQLNHVGEWIDLECHHEIHVTFIVDIYDTNTIEYCMITPFGRFYKNTIRIKVEGREDLNFLNKL